MVTDNNTSKFFRGLAIFMQGGNASVKAALPAFQSLQFAQNGRSWAEKTFQLSFSDSVISEEDYRTWSKEKWDLLHSWFHANEFLFLGARYPGDYTETVYYLRPKDNPYPETVVNVVNRGHDLLITLSCDQDDVERYERQITKACLNPDVLIPKK